jgi:glycosyltransferase involved in cell wall biosynthesis
MRVLHLYAGNLFGGIESLLVTLARYRGHGGPVEPHFALCFPGRLREELQAAGVPVHDLGATRFGRPWTVWKARAGLGRLLRQERYAAVVCHSCWPHALFAPVVRRHGLPLIHWAHDVPTGRHWLERLARRTPPDRVIANSRHTELQLGNLFPAVPSEVVYCPVPSPPVLDRAVVRREVRRELATDPDAVVLVTACRLERWKGHTLLLAALRQLKDLASWNCWIAGGVQRPNEQVYLTELIEQARQSGLADRIRFLGQRSDVGRLLAAADIHCQPNTGPEPFGIAFVEALYAGLPVVTTAVGGAVEIVDGTCGELVGAGAGALAEALRRLCRDAARRERLGANGPARARALCDPPGQLARFGRAVTEVVSGGARGEPFAGRVLG